MKSIRLIGLICLTSCTNIQGFFKPKEELVIEEGCAIVVPNKLRVCETPEFVSIERGRKSISWSRGAFVELLSQKIELGLKKSGILLGYPHQFRLSVFSEALMTERILWLVQVESGDSILGFCFPESPSEWGDAKPLWMQSKSGNDASKFTGRLLVQWDDKGRGISKELFKELFPEYRVNKAQGLVWELGIPLQDWREFGEKVSTDPWISKGIKAMQVVPYSATLGREREITSWTWQKGVAR
ncbi:MAG: hypothetical protein WCI18_06265 [Pseudomonadota bacterium]